MTLELKQFGSYFVGGRLHEITGRAVEEIAFTAQTRYRHDPNGHQAVEGAYVQFFVPARSLDRPPIVLVHGGGMTGAMWEATPDGRPGWLQGLLDRGHEVHVIDLVERGRAGWAPGLWPGEPVLRTMEEAWSLFRFGPPDGFAKRRAFPGQRFPVGHLETFARQFVPRWTSTTEAQVAALGLLLERLGEATLIAHSQGAAVAASAMSAAPGRVATLIALEPSGFMVPPSGCPPVRIVTGDYLDCDALWRDLSRRWDALADSHLAIELVPLARGFPGTSHMMMMDEGADAILEVLGSQW